MVWEVIFMAVFCCNDKCSCTALAVVVSALIGVVTAFLRISAVITVAPLFFQSVIAIAVLLLVTTLFSAAANNSDTCKLCLCSALKAQLVGILGSIATALVLLAVAFAATSTLGAVFVGLLLFFFSLALSSTACMITCLFCND